MFHERRYKHQPKYQPSSSRKRRHTSNGGATPQHPRISEEKRREFERKQKLTAQYELAKRAKLSRENTLQHKRTYEKKCNEIFKKELSEKIFSYGDIPWPEMPHKGTESMFELLFCDLDKSEPEYKKYLREQVVRWHPDRFQQKLGNKLDPQDTSKIMDKVNQISQLLNQHSDTT